MSNAISASTITGNQKNTRTGGAETERGKAIVRHNARRHGILAELRTKYEGNVYDSYLRHLHDEHTPVGFLEGMIVERIAMYCLMLFRAAKAEREFMLSRLSPPISDRLGDFDYDGESYRPTIKTEDIDHLGSTYLRYQTPIENRLYRALHELERMQRRRRGEDVASPVAVDLNTDGGFVSRNGHET